MNAFLTWIVTVNLEPIIKGQYVLMAFFVIGAFTSTENRSNRVRFANLYTLTLILILFFGRFLISYAAQTTPDPTAQIIYNVFSNDVIRVIFNFFILAALFYRLIKTCCYSHARAAYMEKLRFSRR